MLLDLNEVAEGHEYADLGVCEPSPDGRYLAWSVDTQGNEVFTLWIRDLTTGTDERVTDRSYYTSAWSADSRTLFYTVPDATNRPYQVWRHRVGEAPEDDGLVLEEPDGRFELTVGGSRSGELVLVRATSRTTTEISWLPAGDPSRPAAGHLAPPAGHRVRRRPHRLDVARQRWRRADRRSPTTARRSSA